jgi:glycosyltransferase involved in cell wall biosynthesis
MKKLTVSIGIPAHNEEGNIAQLLDTIIKQRQNSYILERIYVACDGCTDKTAEIVSKYAKRYKFIKLIDDKKRLGKAERLNTMYQLNKSDFILIFDADLLLDTNNEIELMVKVMKRNKNVNVVGGRFVPITPTTLMGWFSYISYVSFEDAFMQLNSGNNYYALMGGASLIKDDLAKSFTYPKGTISDQNFLYAMATKNNKNGVKIAKNTRILMKTVATFHDCRISGVRSVVMDKQNIVDLMGEDVLSLYTIPKDIFIKSLIKWFFKSPFYTIGSVIMNVYIRMFPLKKAMPKEGIWILTQSAKNLVINTV